MRLRSLAAAGATIALAFGGASIATVATADPGPNDNNTYGLCTAYSAGSEQGQAKKREHGKPFQSLELAAQVDGSDSYDEAEDKVEAYCEEEGTHPQGKGKPSRD